MLKWAKEVGLKGHVGLSGYPKEKGGWEIFMQEFPSVIEGGKVVAISKIYSDYPNLCST